MDNLDTSAIVRVKVLGSKLEVILDEKLSGYDELSNEELIAEEETTENGYTIMVWYKA